MSDLPNIFESLAGICKFVAVEYIDKEFYSNHLNGIEMAKSFTGVLASNYKGLEDAFRKSLPLQTDEGGQIIEQAFKELDITEEKANWIDSQMTEVLKNLLPVIRSNELPEELEWVKFSIEGAFH